MSGADAAPLPFEAGRHPETEAEIKLIRRRIALLYIAAPGMAMAALLLGFYQQWPVVAATGVIGLGALAIVLGGIAVAERRLFFIVRGYQEERRRYVLYEGIAAVPFGISLIAGGASLIALAGLYLMGNSVDALRNQVLARPGQALIPIGVILAAKGLGFLIGFSRRVDTLGQRAWVALLNLPGRLGGLIIFAWGVAALAIGVVEWLSPAAFDRGFQSIFGNPWPFRQR